MKSIFLLFFCFSITSQAQIVLGVTIKHISCYGDANGKITVSGTGGKSPYTFSLTSNSISSPFSSTNVFSYLKPGVYSVMAKDANGVFSNSEMIFITEPTQLNHILTSADNNVTILAKGGVPPYTYALDYSDGVSNTFENVSLGFHNFTTTDNNGCFFNTFVNVPITLGVEDFDTNNVLKYYPNPVKDRLIISNSNNIDEVAVFSLKGEMIFAKSINKINSEIDMSNLLSGAYLLKIKSGKSYKTVKILKE